MDVSYIITTDANIIAMPTQCLEHYPLSVLKANTMAGSQQGITLHFANVDTLFVKRLIKLSKVDEYCHYPLDKIECQVS